MTEPRRATRRVEGIIFDFDGVLIDSEYVGNLQLAEYLSELGHPTSVEQAMEKFMGLSQTPFLQAVADWIKGPITDSFHEARRVEDERVLRDGIDAIAGAIDFVRSLPPSLPRAVASSSSVAWIERHLGHLGLRDAFGDMIFSGQQHVARGKPAPDLYWHAAKAMGVPIDRVLILEDSPVGVKGALASGAQVVGLCAGRHCLDGHGERLRTLGVEMIAHSFEEVKAIVGDRIRLS